MEARRFGGGALGVPAARHGNDDLGLRREHVVPADLPRSRAGDPEDVLATRDPDLLGDPVAGVEQWIEPLEASDARAGESCDLRFDRCEPNREIVDETLRVGVPPQGRANTADIFEHPREARGVQSDDLRHARKMRRDLVERDRAYRAQGLPEDHVRPRVAQRLLVEVKGALAARSCFADLTVDLACARVVRDRRAGHRGQHADRRRVVVVVRDRDELVNRPDRVHDLRRRGDERDDTHRP